MNQGERSTIPGAQGVVPPEDLRAQIGAIVQRLGERAAMTKLGYSRIVFARLLAGLPVRAGTIVLLRERLAAMEAAPPQQPAPAGT